MSGLVIPTPSSAGHGQAIRRSASQHKSAGPFVFAMIDDAATKAPLSPEPFLARGVQQQLAGNSAVAIQAYLAAERRDPQSLPAHYALADLFYHAGDANRALREIAALARLAPQRMSRIMPYIAVYSRDRSTWPSLRAMFRSDPPLEDTALTALASDPANADAIMALADPQHPVDHSRWPQSLENSLTAAGEYSKARAIERRVGQVWAGRP